MKNPRSMKYTLVPSVQTRLQPLSPIIALMPAIPLRLGTPNGPTLYGTIDTGAKMSMITQEALATLDHRYLSELSLSGAGQQLKLKVTVMSIVLCDEAFSPWIQLDNVPFAVAALPKDANASAILGFESCLSNLRLEIDYPRSRLTVHAPDFERRIDSPGVNLSSRIREGEQLIKMGSYEAAIAIIAAGIEEAVATALGEPVTSQVWRRSAWSERLHLSKNSKASLDTVSNLRNLAVHGSRRKSLSKGDAQLVLRAARGIIGELTQAKNLSTRDG